MTVTMPPVKQVPSPSYTPTPIAHGLFVFHMMEGGYLGSVNWLCRAATKASAHLCLRKDGGELTQLVPLSAKAWAECEFNGRGISLEIEGFTAQGMSEETMRSAALVAGWCCRAYGIPPVWAKGGQGRGLCQHHDLGAAGGGHVDCSAIGSETWLKLVAYTKEAVDAFGDGPLPPFALHGAPGPHQAELPPDVPPEPSHGGAARHDPNEAPAPHPTVSTYPAHSAADLQWRLNRAGATSDDGQPLKIDGWAGNKTKQAIVAFQKAHGLATDGLGPLTWAALDAASA
jgi:hypothetical protein